MATCSSRPKIAGQSNRCCIWPLRHVATMAPSSPLRRHLDLPPTLCIAGSPRCITTPNMSPLEKHLPPDKERLLPTIRMREERLPLLCQRRRVVKLSVTPSSPSHTQLRRAAFGSPIAAFDQPQGEERWMDTVVF